VAAENKAPAFQWYPKDFLTDDAVLAMTNEQVGAYAKLLSHAWLHPDGLSSAPSVLAKMTHCTVQRFERCIWPGVRIKFEQNANGKWFNPKLEKIRQEQSEYRADRSESGKRGAKARWQKDGSAMAQPSSKNGSAIVLPLAKNGSASASASASATTTKNVVGGGADAPAAPPPRTDPIFGRRNPDLFTYGPVKLWASQFRDEILPLVATHYGGDLDAADKPARAWIAELDEQNRSTTPSKDAINKPAKWWSERAAERWGVDADAVERAKFLAMGPR
jgi:uncharacterized protein YdaU (DUF1376 family)